MLTTGSLMVVAIGVAGCGSGDPDPVPSSSAGSAAITIADFDFGESLSVTAGTTVEVTNTDGVGHTWTADGESFASGFLDPGASFDHIFGEVGEFSFFCEIHPSMTGTITVTP